MERAALRDFETQALDRRIIRRFMGPGGDWWPLLFSRTVARGTQGTATSFTGKAVAFSNRHRFREDSKDLSGSTVANTSPSRRCAAIPLLRHCCSTTLVHPPVLTVANTSPSDLFGSWTFKFQVELPVQLAPGKPCDRSISDRTGRR
jgi:hypothetical protein